jgi:hypothetical protein
LSWADLGCESAEPCVPDEHGEHLRDEKYGLEPGEHAFGGLEQVEREEVAGEGGGADAQESGAGEGDCGGRCRERLQAAC